jgi:uncharacterized membrane protein YfcA
MLPQDPATAAAVLACIAIVAALYSSVGHGGASGFLAVLSFFSAPLAQSASAALVLNVFVAGMSWWTFRRAGHFSWRLTWPFALGSVPAAMLAGSVDVPESVVRALLAVALGTAAVLLAVRPTASQDPPADAPPTVPACVGIGGGLGFVAGLVGVGGGIFLSPILVLRRHAAAQRVAATSAMFIVLNSLSGLAGRAMKGTLDITGVLPFAAVAFAGGVVGARLGAGRRGAAWQRALLALVLLVAAAKLGSEALKGT